MRYAVVLLLLIAVCACDQRAPNVRIDRPGLMEGPDMFYICSRTGEEAMIYLDMDGDVWAPIPTGKSCDYELQRLWWQAHPEYAHILTAPARDGGG